MNQDAELLNKIYKGTQMGVDSIAQIKDLVQDEKLCKHLEVQLKEYESIKQDAKDKLNEMGVEEKGLGMLTKMSAGVSISMKTMMDKSPTHLSEMLIQGSTMGVIEATKSMDEYKDADREILSMNKKLLATEENNIKELKKFL